MVENSTNDNRATTSNEYKDDWGTGKLFWGLFLVMIGGLALASNFGTLDIHWNNLFRLWPVIIVAAGLSVLSFRNIVWRIVNLIFALAVLAVIAWSLLSYPDIKLPYTYKVVNDKVELVIER